MPASLRSYKRRCNAFSISLRGHATRSGDIRLGICDAVEESLSVNRITGCFWLNDTHLWSWMNYSLCDRSMKRLCRKREWMRLRKERRFAVRVFHHLPHCYPTTLSLMLIPSSPSHLCGGKDIEKGKGSSAGYGSATQVAHHPPMSTPSIFSQTLSHFPSPIRLIVANMSMHDVKKYI